MRIDLHVHSNASDGTDPPAEVARRAAAAGLDVVALTDHDTMAGIAAAVGAVLTDPVSAAKRARAARARLRSEFDWDRIAAATAEVYAAARPRAKGPASSSGG